MTTPSAEGGPDTVFQRYLAEGRFMIQRGTKSGAYVFYPRTVAPETGEDLEWIEISGRGTVYSSTAIRRRPPEVALNVALIDLDEGPRMMARVESIDALDVSIGMRVQARITPCEDEEDTFMVVFDPEEKAQ